MRLKFWGRDDSEIRAAEKETDELRAKLRETRQEADATLRLMEDLLKGREGQ